MNHSNYLKRTVVKESIASRVLQETRTLRIFLPPGYHELAAYPILYTQDGQDTFMFGRIATIANYLILDKGMKPIIIVGVDVDKKKRTSEYSPNGERYEHYKDFFVNELIPFVESLYQIDQSEHNRVLLGDSLGGTISLHIALDHPHLFKHIISLSGAFLTPTIDELTHTEDLSWLNMWMLIGTEEDHVETPTGTFNFLQANRDTKELLLNKGADVTYLEREGKHIWGFWQKHLPEALLHVYGTL